MIELPVYNQSGQEVGKLSVDEKQLGGEVNAALLKQAVVMYHANLRQGTVATRGRGDVEGSTRKLYKQKHTGSARRGNIRTNVMKGGGMAFAKRPRDFRQSMPTRQRRLARNNAILAKIESKQIKILDQLSLPQAKTKEMARVLSALKIDRSVLIAPAKTDQTLVLSSRNIPYASIKPALEINAYDILKARTLLMTRDAMETLLKSPVKTAGASGA
ncbi:MAG: 50S ribosomal protein L4 [Phycisphaerae bacterium]